MAMFTLRDLSDGSTIEVLAMNIDASHQVLVKDEAGVRVITIDDFKDMVLGTFADAETGEGPQPPTHEVV